MRLSIGIMVFAFAGCIKPTYSFEPRALPPAPATRAERCYQDARFEIAAASGSYMSMQGSRYITPTASGYSLVGSDVYEYQGDSGLVVYRGGKRFDVRESIRALRDPDVERGYERVLAPTESAYHAYPRWRAAMVVTAGVSSGVVLGATGWGLATGFSEPQAYVMLAGLGGLLVSVIPIIGSYLTRDKHYFHERKLKFFHDPAFAPTLVRGVQHANVQVAADCGYGSPDVPITARAAALGAAP